MNAASISPCGRYRYLLTRQVNSAMSGNAVFIMLNPSTADAMVDDPTIRRCMRFAYRWNCGLVVVANLFSYRATDPADLKKAQWPCGQQDLWALKLATRMAERPHSKLVCAWGAHGGWRDRDREVMDFLTAYPVKPMCLGTTKGGYPRHPLYVAGAEPLQPYTGRP